MHSPPPQLQTSIQSKMNFKNKALQMIISWYNKWYCVEEINNDTEKKQSLF
jgi:hypothetical protein